ncbi:MAG: choice-of-anchor E domain-containing protein [Candidatus Accumulibacter sp.]|uniref:choice-of-anchor E domain-containing protein n=1 Tax=Accumulibacter sp. TaxID=2053492 RepID=UPI001A56539C|nr:choice-of-anchor E domain-containing protein [Accumulibacter sp.]MBL8394457.1 choice-of-anchor E domain-containing protein [Accumulibacter sp.]
MKKYLLAAAVVSALGIGSASAASVSYDFTFPLSVTEIDNTGTLGLFDSTLGTLTQATLEVTGAARFLYTGTNQAVQNQSAILTSSTTIFWDSSINALDALLAAIGLSDTSGVQTYAPGETKSFGPVSGSITDTDLILNAATLNLLQAAGGGTFTLNCQSLSGFQVQGGGGNIDTTQDTQAGCGAKITYEYNTNQTPEPASMLLVGLGLLGLGAARRRQA